MRVIAGEEDGVSPLRGLAFSCGLPTLMASHTLA